METAQKLMGESFLIQKSYLELDVRYTCIAVWYTGNPHTFRVFVHKLVCT